MIVIDYHSGRVLATLESSQQLTAWLTNNNALLHHKRGSTAYVFNK